MHSTLAVLLLGLLAATQDPAELEQARRRAGWRPLFDGTTTAGWIAHGLGTFPPDGWRVEDGCLVHEGGGGDLVFGEPFTDFELELEWSVEKGGNSGVKYRVAPVDGEGDREHGADRAPAAMLGPEYQILDDTAAGDGATAKHGAGALYDLAAPEGAPPAAPDVFHRARIVAQGDRIEHWLDGLRVVEIDRATEAWRAALASSKFRDLPDFAAARPGLIGLQDHGDRVRYRNVWLRDLANLPGEPVELFDGESLDGWKVLGDAIYEADDGTILGRIGGGGQSFLVTERTFADFLLEIEVKTELPGNSGIQVRSHVDDTGRLHGYQFEIDPSDRAWSGGLYDEARRGWLDDLSDDALARSAYRHTEWNHYRIECIGPTLRAWVNGIPTADFIDHTDTEGLIGLQVHSGNNTRVRWRNLHLRNLPRPK